MKRCVLVTLDRRTRLPKRSMYSTNQSPGSIETAYVALVCGPPSRGMIRRTLSFCTTSWL